MAHDPGAPASCSRHERSLHFRCRLPPQTETPGPMHVRLSQCHHRVCQYRIKCALVSFGFYAFSNASTRSGHHRSNHSADRRASPLQTATTQPPPSPVSFSSCVAPLSQSISNIHQRKWPLDASSVTPTLSSLVCFCGITSNGCGPRVRQLRLRLSEEK